MGATEMTGNGSNKYCWLRHTTFLGNIVPVLCIIMINLMVFIVVLKRIHGMSSVPIKKCLKEQASRELRGLSGMLPILGLSWVFGIFSVNQDLNIFQYLFAVFSSLQGLFIFLFFVVMNSQMRQAVARKIKIYESGSSTSRISNSNIVSNPDSTKEHDWTECKDGAGFHKFSIPRCNISNTHSDNRKSL
eukprot:XP_019929434.1 PREDICTED: adhesion G-protein coupled receptor D1-like isoform X1 [Crassostrea gigas]